MPFSLLHKSQIFLTLIAWRHQQTYTSWQPRAPASRGKRKGKLRSSRSMAAAAWRHPNRRRVPPSNQQLVCRKWPLVKSQTAHLLQAGRRSATQRRSSDKDKIPLSWRTRIRPAIKPEEVRGQSGGIYGDRQHQEQCLLRVYAPHCSAAVQTEAASAPDIDSDLWPLQENQANNFFPGSNKKKTVGMILVIYCSRPGF